MRYREVLRQLRARRREGFSLPPFRLPTRFLLFSALFIPSVSARRSSYERPQLRGASSGLQSGSEPFGLCGTP